VILRGEKPARLGHGDVALDRADASAEEASCLCLEHTPLDGLVGLLSEVFGVGAHPRMLLHDPAPLLYSLNGEAC
jgi:hypothetical protein